MTWRPAFAWIAALCLFVAVTNRYAPAPLPGAMPSDAYAYSVMAQAAPDFPAEPMLYHHAQRIAAPFLVGLLRDVLGVPLHGLFVAATIAVELGILLVTVSVLRRLRVPDGQSRLIVAILALNPWAFRFYLTFPEMLPDLVFVLGMTVALDGLLRQSAATLLAGQFIASAGRQTGLLLIPVAVFVLWLDRERWKERGAPPWAVIGAAAAVAGGVYAVTGALAGTLAAQNDNTAHVTGLMTWLRAEPDARAFGGFMLRLILPLLIPLACMAALARHRTRVTTGSAAPLMAATAIVALQPLLAGPVLTGGNGPRLAALGLVPLCLALGILLRDVAAFAGSRARRLFLALLALGSIHHWYVMTSTPGPVHQAVFAALTAAAVLGCAALTRREAA